MPRPTAGVAASARAQVPLRRTRCEFLRLPIRLADLVAADDRPPAAARQSLTANLGASGSRSFRSCHLLTQSFTEIDRTAEVRAEYVPAAIGRSEFTIAHSADGIASLMRRLSTYGDAGGLLL